MLPHNISHAAPGSLRRTTCSMLSNSAGTRAGPGWFSLMVRPCRSVMVRLVRMGFSIETSSTGNPQPQSMFLNLLPLSPPEGAMARVSPPKE